MKAGYSTVKVTSYIMNLMKRAIAFLLILLMIISLISKPYLPYLEYAINKKFISENLCENRNEVELKCNGKCYLKDQLTKNDQEQSEIPPNDRNEYFLFTYLQFTTALDKHQNIKNSLYKANLSDAPYPSVFHPPILFVLPV